MAYVFPSGAWPTGFWPVRYWPIMGDEPPEPPPTILPDLSWVNGLYALILVGNEDGVLIGELAAGIDSLSWQLNEFGQATLSAPRPGAADGLIEFGNRLLIYLDNGLPPWVGFIDPPRGWRYGRAELTGYSGERLLGHRVTGRNRVFNQATPGAILSALLAEQAAPAVLGRGHIDLGGAAVSDSYHYEELLAVAQSEMLAGVDFHVSGAVVDGRIRFQLNVYARRGRDLVNVWLMEGYNAFIDVDEQGPIINEWLAAGAGNDWSDVGRDYTRVRDGDSVAGFGLRQGGKVLTSAMDRATLDALATDEVARSAWPYTAVSVGAFNLPPARFADYDIGDGVGVEVYSMASGYRGTRRMVGREFRPSDGLCTVVLV